MVVANGQNIPFAMAIIDYEVSRKVCQWHTLSDYEVSRKMCRWHILSDYDEKSIDGEAADDKSAAIDICLLSERGGHRLKASLSSVRY